MNKKTVDEVILELEGLVQENAVSKDLEYFYFHKDRFRRMANYVVKHYDPAKTVILDIGSHYLHTSIILRKLGYHVDGMDVKEFWSLDFVENRRETFGINKIVENDLPSLNSLSGTEDKYDLILFTEILEHITFNPVSFWKKLHKVVKSGGDIYISTPNSLSLPSLIRSLKNMISFKGIGTNVDDILNQVTYGHHWKEYSAKELKHYFPSLSDDFEVTINQYNYKNYKQVIKGYPLYSFLAKIGNSTNIFAEELEAIVHVKKGHSWKKELPSY
ncbi:class I SAM-dependent methyltransferase [Litoribacter populi]|uniref:class I SAM-dependent methyltransferase n=1 Tax=Litoribacter populi TaxID=2598460 RepID=UPI00117DB657|nr:class I SAM-dependent methyltransferase [Litoribacter populi]